MCKDSIKKRKSHSLLLQTAAFIIFYPKHTFLPYDFLVAHNINVSFLWHKDFSSREVEQSTLANSQGEVCDEEEAIYYTFGPGKAQKVTDVIKKKSPETS